MKISYNWLKEYLSPLPPAEEAAVILTSTGLEVEGLEKTETIRGGLEGVVVGHVLTCKKHPDADKLSITTVDLGDGEPTQIVCGAPNVAAGQKVLVATIGCTLYPTGEEEGFKIKKSKIRGAESNGMICAEDELGLGTSHEGILVLPAEIPAGTAARDYFQIEDDYAVEIGLTPNRIDAGSHYGVARDLAAWMKTNGREAVLKLPETIAVAADNGKSPIKVEVENAEAAPRYMGLVVSGLKVAPSPEWLQNRLRAIGINPKNNVVDITTYILHAVGQPLHAFDAGKIGGGKIIVRTCPEGTPFVTLDGIVRKLSATDLMICDATRPMCIAGVFGGMDSGVTEETTSVFIESAYFNPVWVRKTAKFHGLNTDSSFRFERGVDPEMTPYALLRAAQLMVELAGGTIVSGVIDSYPVKLNPFPVSVSFDRINKLIGKEIPAEKVKEILGALEIKIEKEIPGGLDLLVPAYRVDVKREADVVEEILRIYGYNNVEIPQQVRSTLAYVAQPDRERMVNSVSDFLTSNGFNEIMSNSLTKASYYEGLANYPAGRCVKILNPLSNDLNVMRQTLIFNALESAQLNVNRRHADLKFYEFGNCYFYDEAKKEQGGLAPYREEFRLAMLVTGAAQTPSWNTKSTTADFFTLKAYVEQILRRFGADIYEAQTEPLASDFYAEAVSFKLKGKRVFEMGVISKKLRNAFDIRNDAYYLEMDFGALMQIVKNHTITVTELTNYPEVRRDLALLVDRGVSFEQLRRLAFSTEKKLLKKVTLFDVYEGDKLPAGKKSYALGFVLQDPAGTMTDAATDRIVNALIGRFEKETGAQVRN